jgi:hypothetical protein
MSLYNLNRVFYLADIDPEFLSAFKSSPSKAVETFKLAEPERKALLSGDIKALYDMGVHTFLLTTTVRHALLGMTRERYEEQIKS